MENQAVSMVEMIIKTHIDLERQGPGSRDITLKALSFIDDLNKISRVVDLGCGTGGQTTVIAQNIPGSIIGVDQFADFVDRLNNNAGRLNLQGKLKGMVGSMEELPFSPEEFDLIWSEGAIDSIGFEKGLSYWNGFLKKDGYIAVSSPSWLTDEHPVEVERFWTDAGSRIDSVADNISTMQKAGYSFVASFVLPERCWTEHYFVPREAREQALLKEYPGNKMVEDYLAGDRYEADLYARYKQHYGYVFYIGRKYK
jgi:SAM-dependent methyltransferase